MTFQGVFDLKNKTFFYAPYSICEIKKGKVIEK